VYGIRKLRFMIDVRRLRLLRELHARGTVAAVAEAVAYSPSAVSQALAALEREAGVQLTERVGRRLRLTEAGLRLVEHAGALLERLEIAEAELQAAAGLVAGRLRLGALQTPSVALVPPALNALAERHPALRVELIEAEPEQSLPAVALGELDVAIAEEYQHAPRAVPPALEREELCRDEILLALPPAHPLARRGDPVSLPELAGETWVSSHTETGWAAMVEGACRRIGGFEPDVRHRANDVWIMASLVAAGHGVALMPRLGHAPAGRDVAVRRVAGAELHRTIYAFHRRSTAARPAVRALVDALRAAAGDLP
jgi:DNA-binding transcriptional LysR family regulator